MQSKPFTFLVNKGWRNNFDRGGTMYAVEAFLNEFTSTDNVQLVIKINSAYGIPDINKLLEELRPKDKVDYPRIIMNLDNIPYNQLVNIYNQCHCFVLPSRAESFGIPILEASACSIPSITSDYGGFMDFMDDSLGIIVKGKLEEVKHEVMYEGVKWNTIDINELRKAMRYAYNNQEEMRLKGENAKEKVKKWTWDNSANLIVNLLEGGIDKKF